jgi:hypothetical protein
VVRDTLSGVSLVSGHGHTERVSVDKGLLSGVSLVREKLSGFSLIRDILSGVPMIRGSHAFMDVMRQENAVGRFSGQRHSVI